MRNSRWVICLHATCLRLINSCLEVSQLRWVNRGESIEVSQSRWINRGESIEVSQSRWVNRGESIDVSQSRWVNRGESIEVSQSRWVNRGESYACQPLAWRELTPVSRWVNRGEGINFCICEWLLQKILIKTLNFLDVHNIAGTTKCNSCYEKVAREGGPPGTYRSEFTDIIHVIKYQNKYNVRCLMCWYRNFIYYKNHSLLQKYAMYYLKLLLQSSPPDELVNNNSQVKTG